VAKKISTYCWSGVEDFPVTYAQCPNDGNQWLLAERYLDITGAIIARVVSVRLRIVRVI